MGSDSDYPVIQDMIKILKDFDIEHELTVSSAHRSPDRTQQYAAKLEERGIQVVIACAGAAAHLAGVIAAHTILPVIGVPIDSSPLHGSGCAAFHLHDAGGRSGGNHGHRQIGRQQCRRPGGCRFLPGTIRNWSERLRKYKKRLADRVEQRDSELRKARDV